MCDANHVEKKDFEALSDLVRDSYEKLTQNLSAQRSDLMAIMLEHNKQHEAHMVQVLPIIKAYEVAQDSLESATTAGKWMMKLAGIFTVVGVAWLTFRQIFFKV